MDGKGVPKQHSVAFTIYDPYRTVQEGSTVSSYLGQVTTEDVSHTAQGGGI